MGVFSNDNKKITCIYNGESDVDAQTLGYLKASEKALLAIDITKDTITGTQWAELADKLEAPLYKLINNDVVEDNDVSSFSDDDCIKILRENPEALNGAIIFSGDKAMQIQNPTNAQKFINDDTAAIEKPYNKHKSD